MTPSAPEPTPPVDMRSVLIVVEPEWASSPAWRALVTAGGRTILEITDIVSREEAFTEVADALAMNGVSQDPSKDMRKRLEDTRQREKARIAAAMRHEGRTWGRQDVYDEMAKFVDDLEDDSPTMTEDEEEAAIDQAEQRRR